MAASFASISDVNADREIPREVSLPLPGARAARGWFSPPAIALVAVVLVHFLWLTAHLAPAIMSPDANGYVVQARLIAQEGRTSFSPASPVQFVGMHWLETERGVFHSRYPAGLPVLFAAAWKVGGLGAALYVNPLLASATLLLVFLLARRLVSDWFALLAVVVVATIPSAAQHALDADAHIAATFFLVAGILSLQRFADSRTLGWGLTAGVLLGTIPTIRYPEAIVGVPIAAWLLWRVRPVARVWPAVVGAAVPLLALCLHNAAAYGAFWRTGYALTNEQTGFGLGYFVDHAIPYLQALGGNGLALFFAFGAAGLAALAADRRWRGAGLLYVGLVVPLVLVYMAYYFGGPGGGGGGGGAMMGNLRFLIPTFPFLAIAAAWLLAQVAAALGRPGRIAVGVVAALQLLVAGSASAQALTRMKTSLTAAARARLVAEKQIPAGSVLILDRQLAESLDAVGQWRITEESLVAGMGPRMGPGMGMGPGMPGRGPRAAGGEIDETAPNPMQRGKNRAQQERYAGLNPAERRARLWADVVTWADGRPIYWFARTLDAVENALPAGSDYESIAEVDAPTMGFGGPGPGRGGPGGGAPMMGPGRGRGARGGPGGGFGPMGPGGGGPRGMAPPGGPPMEESGPAKLRLVKVTLAKA